MKISIAAFALLVASVSSECNNGCNGRGRCTNYEPQYSTPSPTEPLIKIPANFESTFGYDTTKFKKDTCTCFHRLGEVSGMIYAFQGADCSEFTCPYGRSWDAGINTQSNDDHNLFAECSDRGFCDRASGSCKCLPGYDGKACQRTTCPNDCSKHGVCKTLHEIAKLNSENTAWNLLSEYDYTNIKYESAWDADKMRGCECDSGWRGPDCSIAECPSGADPLGGEGSESGRACSGRGHCQADGVCQCYTGYFGTRCEKQSAIVR